ncbi:MAG: winged helix-turn-helix domain-containing protein [Candidatus Woesearchaeota archaeon]
MEKNTAFLEVFGDSPVLKVLDFLIVNEDFDYSMTDIANLSGVGYSTLKRFFGKLVEKGIVIKVREVGKAKMYKLNMLNPIVKRFRDLYWETARQKVRTKAREPIVT